jgi:hypothetical protein
MKVSKLCLFALAGLGTCWAQNQTQSKKPCSQIPLLAAAWKALPLEQRFPCDPEHLAIVEDYAAFLEGHPDVAADPVLREKGRHAIAFVVSMSWPIYINLDSHRQMVEAYRSNSWMAFAVAAMLVHERVHATGEASEAAGLRAELSLDQRFRKAGKLPARFDLRGMEQQVRDQERIETLALTASDSRSSSQFAPGKPGEEKPK